MLSNELVITVGAGSPDILTNLRQYNLTETAGKASTYGDPASQLDTPSTLFASHEVSKDGNRRNSVLILKDLVQDNATPPALGVNQVMVKITTDLKVVTKEQVTKLVHAMATMLLAADAYVSSVTDAGDNTVSVSSTFSLEKFLNGEH